jgi:formylglycine-generating enzyme required for sulfatase activity/serine/threonine protein kinase
MSQETNVLSNGYRLQEYSIESVLGAGGFGITYKARDTHLDACVAIKEYFPAEWAYRGADGATVNPNSQGQVIIPEVQTSGYEWGLSRFLDEARVLARVLHPYVVRIRRYFRANGTAYIVMDYEEGEPLSALLRRQTLLSEQQLRGLLQEVLPALEAVHKEGYLHRDLKPSNLYVRARDGGVMLIDFGAARQSLSQRSKSITGLVTPGYSPPEQYVTRSDRYGPWTDIYALGAVLYRCTIGKSPIEAPDRQMWDTLVPAVEAGAGHYPAGFLAVVDKALAMHPEERFQTVAEMRAALTAAGFDITTQQSMGALQAAPKGRERPTEESPSKLSLATFSQVQLALVEPPETPSTRLSIASPAINALSGRSSEAGDGSQVSPIPVPGTADKDALLQRREPDFPAGSRAEAGAAKPGGSGGVAMGAAERLEHSGLPSMPAAGLKPRAAKAAARPWDSVKSGLQLPSSPSSTPGNQNLVLLIILSGLLALLGGMTYRIYQNYQERLTTLKEEQLAQEAAVVRSVAQEEAQRKQRNATERQVQDYLEQMRQAMQRRDWDRAAAYLERADTLQPDNPQLAAMRAELEAQQHAVSAAEIWVEPRINMPMVRLKRGCFAMGTPADDNSKEPYSNETQHQVCLDHNFWIGQHEVTNAQFRLFQPEHSSGAYKGVSLNDDRQPVVEVSWHEANAFARWLSGQTGRRYRLPTEAEWEYAARAANSTARFWGDDPNAACKYANVADRTAQQVWGAGNIHQCDDGYALAAPVASYLPNAFQLYDMLGNVSEWTCSEYKSNYDNQEKRCTDDHIQNERRTVRGGSWNDGPRLVRAADRNGREPDRRDDDLGFRLVLEE